MEGRGRLGVTRDDEQRRHAVAKKLWAEHHQQRRSHKAAAERERQTPHHFATDGLAVVERAHLRDRILDDAIEQRLRHFRLARARRFRRHLHRTDQLFLQRRILLFDVERDLIVGDAAAQRPEQPHGHQRDDRDKHDNAETQDRFRRKGQRLQARRRQDEGEDDAGQHKETAAQRELHAPPLADVLDDLDQFCACVHTSPQCRPWRTGRPTYEFRSTPAVTGSYRVLWTAGWPTTLRARAHRPPVTGGTTRRLDASRRPPA